MEFKVRSGPAPGACTCLCRGKLLLSCCGDWLGRCCGLRPALPPCSVVAVCTPPPATRTDTSRGQSGLRVLTADVQWSASRLTASKPGLLLLWCEVRFGTGDKLLFRVERSLHAVLHQRPQEEDAHISNREAKCEVCVQLA